ncbi:MAG TPA: ATPase, T2SS/T4P/T4SS family [Candidatus Saccharimonadales bacterium]|nr:ATPase, T2SS/T4P/T4SS family [Candidatus Saccharimonadales bacterium]
MGAKDLLSGTRLGGSQKFTSKQIAETLDKLVEQGVTRGASDIHIEPFEHFVLVRYRIDGALRGVHKLPHASLPLLMAAIKKRAALDPEENDLPAEGRYTATLNGQEVHVQVATMPVYGGEKAVLHISTPPGKPQALATLGFWGENLATLQRLLAHPQGMLVVAGQRHCGASSTLFSLLDQLNNPIVNIATVESHPKHRLPGVNQTYTDVGGMSIADGLKAVLRQDPNIVLLSDMPDGTTAKLAVHAASTGHCILARMYAESAVAAVIQLRATGAEPFLLASSLKACISQRLVRALCPHCRERSIVSADEQKQLHARLGLTTAAVRKRVTEMERSLAPAIFGDVKQLNSSPSGITHLWRASSEGCAACGHSGYQGRIAIVEVLEITEPLQQALLASQAPSVGSLHAVALKHGFVPLALDGLLKALRGQTTIAEVLKVIGAPLD